MTQPTEAVPEKPRTLARRRQVLDAAERCFRRDGFHASSMAEISHEAGMSVGHIYRYFTGKEAIIAAIVREDVEAILDHAAHFPTAGPDLKAALIHHVDEGVTKASDPERAALMLEIRAEAARNPEIATIVREADAKISQYMRGLILDTVGRKLDKAELDARVEMFHLIFQGIALRTTANPDLNRKALSQIVKLTLDAILT
jgi:AcrR family transcriptional regulator